MVPKELFFLPYKILWSSTIGNILILYHRIFFQIFFFKFSSSSSSSVFYYKQKKMLYLWRDDESRLRKFFSIFFFQDFFFNFFFKMGLFSPPRYSIFSGDHGLLVSNVINCIIIEVISQLNRALSKGHFISV